MQKKIRGILLLLFLFAFQRSPGADSTPSPKPEMRGVWVATVGNIDWPSKPGLSTEEQKRELIAILDRAAQVRLNTIIFQVRPNCDALYSSSLEPWTEYLTGHMGQPPEPFYDPLALALTEAHKRGLELHAWFNPFRARHDSSKSPVPKSHVSRQHPEFVRTYGDILWLDPGEKAAQEYSMNVVLDVVRRYDIDGVQLDDYFYPYVKTNAFGRIPFPDDSSYGKYTAAGGKMVRNDWRRENINQFVQNLHRSIHAAKPKVKFGISPFGIWRPGSPAQIRGLDAFEVIYTDSKKWLANGWVDYFSPQLYWPTSQREQSYPVLLQWWKEQNVQHRFLCPGLSLYRNSPEEIVQQIRLAREHGDGVILFSMKTLMQNRRNIADILAREVYSQPAPPPR